MGDVFFSVRMLVITIVVAVFLQIKVGGMTLETRVHAWVQSNSAVDTLRDVSRGAVKMIRVGYKTVVNLIDARIAAGLSRDQTAGSRPWSLDLGGSDAFMKEQGRVTPPAGRGSAPDSGSAAED